ncbi:Cytochrome oxidase maturation protein [uncultured Gammaproteobacteria bacterium]
MNEILLLIAVALTLGALGLAGFLWAVNNGQFDDLDGAAHRILFDDEPESAVTAAPIPKSVPEPATTRETVPPASAAA